jgi:hypothetical protein
MISVVRRNQEKVIPHFLLRNLVLDRLFGEDQADAGAVFYVFGGVIAVMNLELQIGTSGNSQGVTGRTRLGQVSGQVVRCAGRHVQPHGGCPNRQQPCSSPDRDALATAPSPRPRHRKDRSLAACQSIERKELVLIPKPRARDRKRLLASDPMRKRA